MSRKSVEKICVRSEKDGAGRSMANRNLIDICLNETFRRLKVNFMLKQIFVLAEDFWIFENFGVASERKN